MTVEQHIRISYWTKGEEEKNFGDYLAELFLSRALIAPIVQADTYRLLGSAISDDLIEHDIGWGDPSVARVAYWGCGMRDDVRVSQRLRQACGFFGVRGPLSRDRLGLDPNIPLGDPGLLAPLLVPLHRESARTVGLNIAIPHFSIRDAVDVAASGADRLVSPSVRDEDELIALLNDIAHADFVLSNSLHGAIIACSFDRPFAFWDAGSIDCPFKWADFAASIGIEPLFARSVEEGKAIYDAASPRIRRPALFPLLACCPFAVRPGVLLTALAHDAAQGHPAPQALWLDRDDVVATVREWNLEAYVRLPARA